MRHRERKETAKKRIGEEEEGLRKLHLFSLRFLRVLCASAVSGLYYNVTVIPGTGASPIENATILIRDDRIAAIGPAADIVIPTGARKI